MKVNNKDGTFEIKSKSIKEKINITSKELCSSPYFCIEQLTTTEDYNKYYYVGESTIKGYIKVTMDPTKASVKRWKVK